MLRSTPLVVVLLCSCQGPPDSWTPSDDPDDYIVDSTLDYRVEVGKLTWVVPSPGLPPGAKPLAANNNVDIVFHGGRLFLAWRTSEFHFASTNAAMVIVSAPAWDGEGPPTWQLEQRIALGADVREPRFLSTGDRLLFHWFEAGTVPTSFEPRFVWRIEREGPGRWSAPEKILEPKEVPWMIKGPRRGRYFLTSYTGDHYSFDGKGHLELRLRISDDGVSWGKPTTVYQGGVSEAAVELDAQGGLWAVTRNEEGDSTGFGSHLCRAPATGLLNWSCPQRTDPERYDSPWMFRHGEELYLVARRDVGGPYDQGLRSLELSKRRTKYMLDYSLRPKRTALYQVDRGLKRVRHVVDLPSAGDTAFPSVRRLGPHTFLLANYTSPLDNPNATWLDGQTSPKGTQIYFLRLTFKPLK